MVFSVLEMDPPMDCSIPSTGDDVGKGRTYELKGIEEDQNSPGKVTSKTDSQSTEGS